MQRGLVFGVLLQDDGISWPSRNQLMLAMAEKVPVVLLYASTSRSRLAWIRPLVEQTRVPNVFGVRDAYALRFSAVGCRVPRIAAAIDGRWLRKALERHGIVDPVMWLTVAEPALARSFKDTRLVYDCMDPNFLPERQRAFDRAEFQLAGRAAVVFASAASLRDRMAAVNPRTYLLPNAMQTPRAPYLDELPRPPQLPLGRPVAGYLGTVDWRFDAEYVEAAARALPGVTFAIAGRVNRDQEHRLAALRELTNVVMPGQLSETDGRAWTAAFDVGLIPFTPCPMNDAINPVKMWMYLAQGLPVVSTATAECRANPFVVATDSPAAFVEAVRYALAERDDNDARSARVEFARQNTWHHRAEEAASILSRHGLLS